MILEIIIFSSYLLGSVPFGFLLTKIFLKKDIRDIGSGNIGATNALRTGSKLIGFTTLILDILKSDSRINPERCVIDHVEEHTVKMVLDEGFWAGMTLYPETKCTSNRAIDILEVYGNERIWMNSACDWGASVPLSVPMAMQEMKRRGKNPKTIDKIVYQNPIDFMSQSPRFLKLDNL